jgi:hypothetical protein
MLPDLFLLMLIVLAAAATKRISRNEHIKVRGDVLITEFLSDGRTLKHAYHNLVVNGGKSILAGLLGHSGTFANEYIDTIAFGSGSTVPVVTNTTLQTQILTETAVASYPAFNSVTFSATMQSNEGVASTFQELGLLSHATGKLFSRLAISPITKDNQSKIQVDWTISFQ